MKKIVSVLLCGVMMLAAASCNSAEETKKHDRDIETHDSPKTDADNPASTAAGSSAADSLTGGDISADFDPDFTFSTTDRDGNTWDETTFSQYDLTMINFWEPWCGPCVGEIPDLERLYEDYKDKGFQIIGVYSEETMESDVDAILKESNVSYPVLHYSMDFDQFQSGYVPTTIFVDREGHVLNVPGEGNSVIGSKTYSAWASIIERLL